MSKFKAIGSSLLVIMLMYFSQMLAYMTASVALLIGMPTLLYYIIAGVIYFSLFLVLSKVVFEKVMHMKIFDFGIVPFSVKPIWVIIGIMLPLSVIGIYIMFIRGEFAFAEMSSSKKLETLIGGLFFNGLAVGFVEEMVFRGILFHSLKKAWNTRTAVIGSSVLFGIIHILGGGISPASCLATVISVTTIGIAFSLITIDTGAVWCSGIIHAIWNFILGSIFTISGKTNESAIITYILNTKSIAITGGDFGIESSAIAFILYVIVAIIALYMIKNRDR